MRIYFPGGKKVYADYNGFTIKTDQSPAGGGEGSAPEPFSLFLASMGTCVGIYVLGFCQQRNLNTEGLEIRQSLNYDPVKRLVDKVEFEIRLPSDFPEKYLGALKHTAKLCTVKKHLDNPPEFHVETRVA